MKKSDEYEQKLRRTNTTAFERNEMNDLTLLTLIYEVKGCAR